MILVLLLIWKKQIKAMIMWWLIKKIKFMRLLKIFIIIAFQDFMENNQVYLFILKNLKYLFIY